ncbi:MAG: leucine-rich repeat domain-containing protein [Balneolaceae bacterium]|nr:leucine-rich repeat domain-containing protein [Balneolaceae bacterium]
MKKLITTIGIILLTVQLAYGQNSDSGDPGFKNEISLPEQELINSADYLPMDRIQNSIGKFKGYTEENINLKSYKVKANDNDSLALVALYNNTDGENWSTNTNWLTGLVSSWSRVVLDSTGRVVQLNLGRNSLKGEIPIEIGNLASLKQLYMYDNELSGEIPSEVGNLNGLEVLYLWGNSLTGSIPEEIGTLSELRRLSLGSNDLNGEVPSSIWTLDKLIYLSLTRNKISGTLSADIANLDSLDELALGGNEFSGEIPAEIGELKELTELYLWGNEFTGEIPEEIGVLTKLENLQLSQNNLTGEIPESFSELINLTTLSLWSNNLTGEIPDGLGALNKLRYLYLSQNNLEGEIPESFSNLINLYSLFLWGNNLTGEIPTWFSNYLSLEGLHLSFNKLYGEIPKEIFSISTLKDLYLNNNQLTGDIPKEVEQSTLLENLYLSRNNISGEIPTEISSLSNLERLNLDRNQLSGSIPAELGHLSQLEWLYLDGNELSGEIPAELGNLSSLRYLFLSDNNLSGVIPEELKNLDNLYYLRLFGNQLTGEVPEWLTEMESIIYISLGRNNLTGTLPESLNAFTESPNLRYFYVYDNQLHGEVPEKIWELDLYGLRLDQNDFEGQVPNTLANMDELNYLHLDGNRFTSLPDLSAINTLVSLHIDSLKLTFKDIVPNLGIAEDSMSYAPQFPFGDTTAVQATIGSDVTFGVDEIDFVGNKYQWEKDGVEITGQNSATITITDVTQNDYGKYVVKVRHDSLPDLIIESEPFYVSEDGQITNTKDEHSNSGLPEVFTLNQNYPNPFNPSSTIQFGIPEASSVRLEVFNLLGQKVSTLVAGDKMQAGWHSVQFDAGNLASGVYIYRIEAGNFVQTKRMMLIK